MSHMDAHFSDANAETPKRRSARTRKFVPVQLEWIDDNGSIVSVPARTRAVNVYGCLVVSSHDFIFGQRLRLVNLKTQRTLEGQVVWKGSHGRGGWELGVELERPEIDNWGPSA
jgi:hypothetical protein